MFEGYCSGEWCRNIRHTVALAGSFGDDGEAGLVKLGVGSA